MTESVLMERDGVQTLVANNASIQVMARLGWSLVVETTSDAAQSSDVRPDKPRAKPGPKPKAPAQA
jgi:hypothetical protein